MRLKDIDNVRWREIASELDALCDELAEHDPRDEDAYPEAKSVQLRVYERLQSACVDALFCASGLARTDPQELRQHLGRSVPDARDGVTCTQCGERVFPRLVTISALDHEWQVDVDADGRCAVCRWVHD